MAESTGGSSDYLSTIIAYQIIQFPFCNKFDAENLDLVLIFCKVSLTYYPRGVFYIFG